MQIVLLSGGSGKRLWPLSNDVRSKQFLKLFKQDDTYESMVQRVYRQISSNIDNAQVTIATSKTQVSTIMNQLKDNVNVCVEPCRKDTFPAIALACAYLKDVKHVDDSEVVVICPVDPYVNDDYFQTVQGLGNLAAKEGVNLALMGIEPTYPSEKYGYIIPESKDNVSKVSCFKEKPTESIAKEYISQGALWNGGVFALKIDHVLQRAHELIEFSDYYDLFNRYDTLTKISFDYAVVEHESDIAVMRFNGQWKDLGTWNTLTEEMQEPTIGNVVQNDTNINTQIINELDIPLLALGMKDCVIAASAQGILVSDKNQSSYIKPYVDSLEQTVMFALKSWGSFQVLDIQEESMTIRVTLNKGHAMNYHSHQHRDEVWTIISGNGRTIVDGMEEMVKPGDVIVMNAGCKHTIVADTPLQLIEVQLGKDINVNDKIKYDHPDIL